nr:LCP family protein [Lysinibacillus timonensis]
MKKWFSWKVILIIVGALFLIIGGYALYLYNEFKSTMNAIHEPLIIESKAVAGMKIDSPIQLSLKENKDPQPISVLLLGIDNWESSGRADTLLVLTLNPKTEAMKILSIPRDTYAELVGFDFSDKINHSYAYGGVETALLSVENLLQIPINYVVTVNMEGFVEIVDILGGVEVNNQFAFSTDAYDYPEGNQTLTGDQAIHYVRMRKEDPAGDFGRQNRQQQVLESLFTKGASINLIWQAPSILTTIRNHVETNLTFDEMIELQNMYRSSLKNIDHLNFSQGDGRIKDGVWYYFLNEEELKHVQQQLQDSLK